MIKRGVYVIELASGYVKVGASNDVLNRVTGHRSVATTYGSQIRRVWLRVTKKPFMVERIILLHLSAGSPPIAQGRETYKDVTFEEAVSIAEWVVVHRKRLTEQYAAAKPPRASQRPRQDVMRPPAQDRYEAPEQHDVLILRKPEPAADKIADEAQNMIFTKPTPYVRVPLAELYERMKERALELLQTQAYVGASDFTEMVKDLGWSRAIVYRTLDTLTDEGVLEKRGPDRETRIVSWYKRS